MAMAWTAQRRADQALRMKAWHASRNPERAAARERTEAEARKIATARASKLEPVTNPFWRDLIGEIIARTISGGSVCENSLAFALGTTRQKVHSATRSLISRGYLGTNKDSFSHMSVSIPLADADGNPWLRDGHLIRLEQRNGMTIKVCPPRTAAGALHWPQKLNRKSA